MTISEFNTIVSSNKVVVVDFFASWCGPCQMLAPIFLKLEKKYVNVKFVKINVDENQELSSKFNITSIPTVLFFKEGKKTSSFIGFRDESYIENEISKIN